jgi:hypothetical protein
MGWWVEDSAAMLELPTVQALALSTGIAKGGRGKWTRGQ